MISRICGTTSRIAHLDPLPQRHVHHAAALTAAAELNVGDAVAHVEQRHEAAVRGDGGVDLAVDHALHGLRDRVRPERVRVVDLEAALARPLDEVDAYALDEGLAVLVDQHGQAADVDMFIARTLVLRLDEREPVLEPAGPTPAHAEAQVQAFLLLGPHQRQDLVSGNIGDRDHANLSTAGVGASEPSSRRGGPSGPMSNRRWLCETRSAPTTRSGVDARAKMNPR